MSRTMDANMVADQVLHVARFATPAASASPEAIISAFRRCTNGLTDYERNQVALAVNYRLCRPVL